MKLLRLVLLHTAARRQLFLTRDSSGVITTDNIEQAIERAGSKSGNKGWDAAVSAIEMVNLLKAI